MFRTLGLVLGVSGAACFSIKSNEYSYGLKIVRCSSGLNVTEETESQLAPLLLLKKKKKTLSTISSSSSSNGKKNKTDLQIFFSMISAVDWVLYSCAAIMSVLSSLSTTYQSKLIGDIFNALGTSNYSVSLKVLISNPTHPLSQLVLVFFAQSFFSFGASVSLATATTNLGNRMRSEFFNCLLHRSVADFDEIQTGSMLSQLQGDIGSIKTTVRESFTRGIDGLTSLISGSVLLFHLSPSIAFAMITLLPCGAFIGTYLGKKKKF